VQTPRPGIFLTFLLLGLGLAAPLAAQSGKVASVKVSGSAKFPGDQIAGMSGLKPGDEVVQEDIQAAADRLAQLGPFLNVRYRFQSRGAEVDIEFQVEDAPALPVSFDNFPWFADEELAARLHQAVPFYDGTAPEQGTLLELMNRTLEETLKERGVTAAVECSPLGRPDGNGMMMQFRVVGASLRVGAVQFSDPLAGESRRIRERLNDLVGKAYSRFAVEMFVLEQARPVYLEKGHLRVAFGRPTARFTGDPNKPLSDQVVVIIPVEPGPVFNWVGAEWSGITAFGPDALNGILGLGIGELADGNKIQAALDRVRAEYGRRGYLDMQMDATPAFFDVEAAGIRVHTVKYRVEIREGLQYRMGEMVITGLSLAAERKLLAAWKIPAGQMFDLGYFDNFVHELEPGRDREPIFGDLPVHYDEVGRWLRKNTEGKVVDVLLDFK
jgi:outer membrane protein insertion porin family